MKGAKFYSQVMALFDRFSALPPPAVTRETRALSQKLSTAATPAATAAPPLPSLHLQLQQRRGGGGSGSGCDSDPSQLWTEVTKLLTRSGSWRTTLAVLDGLPQTLRANVAQTAAKEQWPLPPDVLLTLTMTSSSTRRRAASPATDATRSGGGVEQNDQGRHLRFPVEAAKRGSAAVAGQSASVELMGQTADGILRLAFECSRPTSKAAALEVGQQQQRIIRELHRRGMVRELLQCVVNWHRRGLVVDNFYASTTTSSEARAVAENVVPYDAIADVRALLFPPPPPADRSAAARSPPPRRDAVLQPPPPWRVALDDFPLLFARCVRDGAACEHFLANGTARREDVYEAMSALLACVEKKKAVALPYPHHIEGQLPSRNGSAPPTSSAHKRGKASAADTVAAQQVAEDVEVLWRAVSCLASGVRVWLRTEPKIVKERLLHGVATALEGTVRVQLWLTPQSAAREGGDGRPGREEEESAKATAISGKAVVAMRGTVESLCSVLPPHEAQVRFLGLPLFARLSLSLDALSFLLRTELGLTNGLVQCLFLCLGEDDFLGTPPTTLPAWQPTDTVLFRFLSAAPMERAEAARDLVTVAQRRKWFRVTSTHLHSLLSGLQSISIVRTWRQALACVEYFEAHLRVRPNDSTMGVVLLNLSQDSWQCAFDVLRYYEGTRQRPPAAVMRDLHLISVKHGAWETTLRMLREMLELGRRAEEESGRGRRVSSSPSASTYVGFMNYLYGLYAAGVGGQARTCLSLFAALADAPGRRGGTSPYNEVTVAVAAVALLDHHHHAEGLLFARDILKDDGDESSVLARRLARAKQRDSDAVGYALTPAGRDMAHALQLICLLHLWEDGGGSAVGSGPVAHSQATVEAEVVGLLNALAVTSHAEEEEEPVKGNETKENAGSVGGRLRRVLQYAAVLTSLCNMSHLHAPIRLVFDTIAGPGVYEWSTAGERTLETRQVRYHSDANAAVGRQGKSVRRTLYIPPSHRTAQAVWLARSLGKVAKASGGDGGLLGSGKALAGCELSTEATRALAEGMASAGVGPEFLKASLL